MVRMLFDTNVYGMLVVDPDVHTLLRSLATGSINVVNLSLIRQELRHTPKRISKSKRSARISLLNLYDQIVRGDPIQPNRRIDALADAFYREYRRQGGNVGRKKMMNDLKIVACASMAGCDIIASEDNRTMKSHRAQKAYGIVAVANNLRPPTFISYDQLKRSITLSSL